jgi:hypothetical protein
MWRDSARKSVKNFAELSTAYGVVIRNPRGAIITAAHTHGIQRLSGFQLREASHGADAGTTTIRIPEYFVPAVQPASKPANSSAQRRLLCTAITVVNTHNNTTNVRRASSLRYLLHVT